VASGHAGGIADLVDEEATKQNEAVRVSLNEHRDALPGAARLEARL